jgi:hypothetical protein
MMTYLNRILLLTAIWLNISIDLGAQPIHYSVQNAHAHNDYLHTVPFYTAFNSGFGSVEADVYPVNGDLLVAHGKSQIQTERTLRKLYLEPLKAELKKIPGRQVTLLVDIKEKHPEALAILIKQLKPLKKYLTTPDKGKGKLTVLISGDRPHPSAYNTYPDYIFFDSDLSVEHTAEQWKRVGLVSLNFTKLSKWKGKDKIPGEDEARLQHTIDSVHTAGKKIRFWAAPDSSNAWEELMRLGVDLIGTDKIEGLTAFLNNKRK